MLMEIQDMKEENQNQKEKSQGRHHQQQKRLHKRKEKERSSLLPALNLPVQDNAQEGKGVYTHTKHRLSMIACGTKQMVLHRQTVETDPTLKVKVKVEREKILRAPKVPKEKTNSMVMSRHFGVSKPVGETLRMTTYK